jgi:nucleolar MIF4G domain-containing protein 1
MILGASRGGKTQIRARKEQRKASRQGVKPAATPRYEQALESASEDEAPPALPRLKTKKRKSEDRSDEIKPKKKKKTELTLPTLSKGDAEDGEIEWLEWMLKKEREKQKAEDDDGLSDGLDGVYTLICERGER